MSTKTAFITIIGRANAGKSSLLNALIGEKIAMVSDKPQTTRTKITGVLTENETQYVFMDTPGMHKAKTKLSQHMIQSVKDSVSGIDLAILVVDVSKKLGEQENVLIQSISKTKTPCILVINKIDLLKDKTELMEFILKCQDLYEFNSIIPVSIINDDGVDIVKTEINKFTVEGPHFFPDDMLTDQPERVLAAEIIREKLLLLLNEEVPHGIAVTVEEMKEREDQDILDITANIFCERKSHKGIIIGKNGSMLKRVGTNARIELENFFRIKVNLQCWVKVKEDWRNKEGMIKNFGLSQL